MKAAYQQQPRWVPTGPTSFKERVSTWAVTLLHKLIASRWIGFVLVLATIAWRSGGDFGGAVTNSVISAAIVYAMLRTSTGRALLFSGWLLLLGSATSVMAQDGVSWETVKTLLIVLGAGAMLFVDWRKLVS